MNSNKTMLEVKDQARVSVTEERIRRAAQAAPGRSAANGVVAVDRPGLKKVPSIPSQEATGPAEPDISNGNRQERKEGRVLAALRKGWAFLFEALREAYWFLDPDAKCRSVGLQTVGRVLKTETRTHTDPEGGESTSHHVTYEYQVDATRHTLEKSVGSLGGLKKGDPIRVYYLVDSSGRNLSPKSAIDRRPARMSGSTRRRLESSPGRTETVDGSNRH